MSYCLVINEELRRLAENRTWNRNVPKDWVLTGCIGRMNVTGGNKVPESEVQAAVPDRR
ncbi:hypothetical protein [Anaerostipes caccae]|uniref:hypothetical protein n=1 Tax=Anaerostipes caccae TaxID=105841 RepID=UPI0038D4E1B1